MPGPAPVSTAVPAGTGDEDDEARVPAVAEDEAWKTEFLT